MDDGELLLKCYNHVTNISYCFGFGLNLPQYYYISV